MLDDVKSDADERMSKSLVALDAAFARIRRMLRAQKAARTTRHNHGPDGGGGGV